MPKTTLPTCVPLPLSENELKELVSKTKDWALMHGIGIRSKGGFSEDSINFAPFVLLPSSFPRREFQKAVDIQVTFNELMHRVAHNEAFLKNTLKGTIQVDEFTGNLYKIWETVLTEGVKQPLSLGLVRNDLMLDSMRSWKQVEFNTIAAGFGWLGPASLCINRFVLEELGCHNQLSKLPDNRALTGIATGLLDAWKLYNDPEGVILMVVEDVTYNICDQRFHEFELKRLAPAVRMIRKTLTEVADQADLDSNHQLVVKGQVINVVYFRCGYSPDQLPGRKQWDARLLIERSKAIKCPSIQYHLAGTKKVQQALAKPGAVEMFLNDPTQISAVKQCFTGLYGLDFDESGDRAVQMALDNPERFVLKPQREGGGNNVYGHEIRDVMVKMKDSKERTAWILMERINPPCCMGYMVRPGGSNPPPLVEMVSELGVFGVVIGDAQKVIVNRQVGHMLRSKVSTANEGGVAAGLGALDSPYLID